MNSQSNISQLDLRIDLRNRVLNITNHDFQTLALAIFRYQAEHNALYKQFLNYLKIKPDTISNLLEIPFLPIQLFKTQQVVTGKPDNTPIVFESSGTTDTIPSRHLLYDEELYQKVAIAIFEKQYGALKNFQILALLPSYLERNNSSLVYMIDYFIRQTQSDYSNFYLNNTDELIAALKIAKENGQKTLLIGVTFALLDFAEANDMSFLKDFPGLIIMDTGGMKGRRQELLRAEVHELLTQRLFVEKVHSEYGMTELLSQCYSMGEGIFQMSQTMKILLRDIYDPFSKYDKPNPFIKTGGINVIDLANLDSISFIETQDLGRFGSVPNTFEILGRFDNSDIRGCNLMVMN